MLNLVNSSILVLEESTSTLCISVVQTLFFEHVEEKNDNQNKHYTWFTLASNVVLVPIPAVDYYTGVFTIPVHYIQTFYSFFLLLQYV